MKKQKNTARQFGGFIDTYTIRQGVEDKSIVPLLFVNGLVIIGRRVRIRARIEVRKRGHGSREASAE